MDIYLSHNGSIKDFLVILGHSSRHSSNGKPRHIRHCCQPNCLPDEQCNLCCSLPTSANGTCTGIPACKDCGGANNAINSTFGPCLEGPCEGSIYSNSCDLVIPFCGDCGGAANFLKDPSSGTCTEGRNTGCPCTSSCDTVNFPSCSACDGFVIDGLNGLEGYCLSGNDYGCPRSVDCPSPGPCGDGACQGVNDPFGHGAFCRAQGQMDCPCNSACTNADIICNSDDCNGFNGNSATGQCTDGPFMRCHCQSVCKDPGEFCADLDGCTGVVGPSGQGKCTAGENRGCSCNMNCPNPPVSCSDGNCLGEEYCGQGKFWACSCM